MLLLRRNDQGARRDIAGTAVRGRCPTGATTGAGPSQRHPQNASVNAKSAPATSVANATAIRHDHGVRDAAIDGDEAESRDAILDRDESERIVVKRKSRCLL